MLFRIEALDVSVVKAVSLRSRGIFNVQKFWAAISAKRESLGLNWKQVAEQTGVSASTLSRMPENRPDIDSAAALVVWLDADLKSFCEVTSSPPPGNHLNKILQILEQDPNLTAHEADMISACLLAMYRVSYRDSSTTISAGNDNSSPDYRDRKAEEDPRDPHEN
jgi:transcriptional regulator with XRE-family HTH domain